MSDDNEVSMIWRGPPRLPSSLTFGEWMRDYAPKWLTGQTLRIVHNSEDMGLYRIVSAQAGQVTVERADE